MGKTWQAPVVRCPAGPAGGGEQHPPGRRCRTTRGWATTSSTSTGRSWHSPTPSAPRGMCCRSATRRAGPGSTRWTASRTDQVAVYDVTDPAAVVRIEGVAVAPSGSRVRRAVPGRRWPRATGYWALADHGLQTVQAIEEDTPSDLGSTANGADYIVITHPAFCGAGADPAQLPGVAGAARACRSTCRMCTTSSATASWARPRSTISWRTPTATGRRRRLRSWCWWATGTMIRRTTWATGGPATCRPTWPWSIPGSARRRPTTAT